MMQSPKGKKKMDIRVGDIVTLKKPHPCGSSEWEILRTGQDFKIKCMGCGHQVMVARKQVEKNLKSFKRAGQDSEVI